MILGEIGRGQGLGKVKDFGGGSWSLLLGDVQGGVVG